MHDRCVPLPFLAIVSIALAAPLCAQDTTSVFPSDHRTREGAAFSDRGPLSAGVQRSMIVYERWDLELAAGARIRKVGMRQNGDRNRSAGRGMRLLLEVCLAHTRKTARTASPTFADNYDGKPTIAFAKKVFDLPAMSPARTSPSRTTVLVPLDREYRYDGARNLLVEYRVHANANGGRPFAHPVDVAREFAPSLAYGAGCRTSGGSAPVMNATGGAIGMPWRPAVARGPSSSPAVLMLGAARRNLDLSAIGMPGCRLLVDPIVVFDPRTTSTAGTAAWSIPVPDNPYLVRKTLHVQAVMSDPFANRLGYVTSNGVGTTFGARPAATMIQASTMTAPRGSLWRHYGLVSVFEWR